MTLNDLLRTSHISPETVLVMRHRPHEPELNKVLPWLAAEKPDVFNAYQQTQGKKVERAMLGANYVASFIGREAGKALFVGLYRIGPSKPLTREEFWGVPANAEMRTFGMRGFDAEQARSTILWFELTLTEFYTHWKGKLIIAVMWGSRLKASSEPASRSTDAT